MISLRPSFVRVTKTSIRKHLQHLTINIRKKTEKLTMTTINNDTTITNTAKLHYDTLLWTIQITATMALAQTLDCDKYHQHQF